MKKAMTPKVRRAALLEPDTAAPCLGRIDVIEDSLDESSDFLRSKVEMKSPGIRYITEDLIKKLTKQDNLAFVQTLNLSSVKCNGKKFKFIENLDKCERLQVLSVSHNLIEKIEKVEKLHLLKELHLSHNRIRKIEGLEHMRNLQLLNLASNTIEFVPPWLAKKLRSLQSLNLQHNNISSLHEVTKLKSLKNLTELVLAENPVSNLPHYRLFLVFHLRALEMLDGLPVTEQERDCAHQRFYMEEQERLEKELQQQQTEMERLREQQAVTTAELDKQDMLSRGLQKQNYEQRLIQAQLERELETKNELLKRKSMELTRACQKQYELEQELAFHKIDAKFEPLTYYTDEVVEEEHLPGESPYIGKARHKRNTVSVDGQLSASVQQDDLGQVVTDGANVVPKHFSQAQEEAEEHLQQLRREIENAEQQILRASTELRQLEEAVCQKRITEAEKEQLRQQLHRKIQQMEQLRAEALALEGQLERQRQDIKQTQGELDQLQDLLESLDLNDPQHAHVKSKVSSKKQLLDMMSQKYCELESRLDDILSRIAKETDEIKDLEQQLTDGQIAANESLKQDLESIICGLQEYLHGVKGQARQAQAECWQLHREKDELERRLRHSEEQRNQLEIVAMDAEHTREELAQLQHVMEALQEENTELKQAQDQVNAYEGQLEERDTEAGKLREELGRLRKLSQMEQSALRAELEKERQEKENALAQREVQSSELIEQVTLLEEETGSLRERLQRLQEEQEQAKATLLNTKDVTRRLEELRRSISSGLENLRPIDDNDLLGSSLLELQTELAHAVSAAQADRDEAYRKHAQEAASLREQLKYMQQQSRVHARDAAEGRRRDAELQRLRDELQKAQELQRLTEQRLQEAEDEQQHTIAELEEREHQMKEDDSHTQHQIQSLEKELRELKRSMSTADRMAAKQLNIAKDQLRALHGTVRKINQERVEDADQLEGTRAQIAAATSSLVRAEDEIRFLQSVLKDRERQAHEVENSNQTQQEEVERLIRALGQQQVQTKKLREQLAQARRDNAGNVNELIEEIEALRSTLANESNLVSNLEKPLGSRGYWYYVPSPPNPPSVGSQGTRDSGLGLQYSASPDRRRRPARRGKSNREEKSSASYVGYWIYSPYRQSPSGNQRKDERDSGGESDGSSSSGWQFTPPPGSAIYTMLPDGSPLPQGSVIYAPPVAGLSVSPGSVIYGPPPAGAQLVYGPPPGSLTAPLFQAGVLLCNVPGHQEMDKELQQLEQQVEELQHEHKLQERLGRDVKQLQDKRTELEQELRQAKSTLRKHRANLLHSLSSQAQMQKPDVEQFLRQHREVQDEVECVEKTLLRRRAELREADRLLLEAESDLKDTRLRTKDMLQQEREAQQRVEKTERELEEMENRAQGTANELVQANQQLRTLQEEVQELRRLRTEQQEAVESKDCECQRLCDLVNGASERLEELQKALRDTQSQEAQQLVALQEVERLLAQRRCEMERISSEVALQLQEMSSLDRRIGKKKEEERFLDSSLEHQRHSLTGVLKEGEEEACDLQRLIKVLRTDLEGLSVQKGELGSELEEKKAQLALLRQEQLHEEQSLDNTRAQIDKHRTELTYVHEKVELEQSELQALKKHKASMGVLHEQRDTLQGQCQSLEGRRRQAERRLVATEEKAKAAETELQRLTHELRHFGSLKHGMSQDNASTQKELEEKNEELMGLKKLSNSAKTQLELINQEVLAAVKRRSELQEELQEGAVQLNDTQHRVEQLEQKLKEQQLQLLHGQSHLQRQQQAMKQQQEEMQHLQVQESAVAERVLHLEERERRLQSTEERYTLLHERLSIMGRELQEKDSQLQVRVEESQALRRELLQAREAAFTERRGSHSQPAQEQAENEQQERVTFQKDLALMEEAAQENHQRAKRLQRELSTVSEELLGLRDKLRHQEEGEVRRREIKKSMKMLKSDVRAEMNSSIRELEASPSQSSDAESHKENQPEREESYGDAAFSSKDKEWRKDVLREKLQQQEDHLKAQLRRCMWSQEEVLLQRRQQTEGSLQGLRRRVERLDQLLCSSP